MSIDSEVIGFAIIIMSPVYAFLYKISLELTNLTHTIDDCPYCQEETGKK